MIQREHPRVQDAHELDASPDAPEVDDVALATPPQQLRPLGHGTGAANVLRNDHLAGLLEQVEVPGALLLGASRQCVSNDLAGGRVGAAVDRRAGARRTKPRPIVPVAAPRSVELPPPETS